MIFIADIQAAVAAEHGLPAETLREPDGCTGSRERKYAWPRQEAMYLSRMLTSKQSTVIGREFRRDHSTVIQGARSVQNRLAYDAELRERLRRVTLRLVAPSDRFYISGKGSETISVPELLKLAEMAG
jgi:chromosomal replication initiation ATPase DnaA